MDASDRRVVAVSWVVGSLVGLRLLSGDALAALDGLLAAAAAGFLVWIERERRRRRSAARV